MSDESEQHILLKTWQNAMKRATDFDAWGQPVEACDIYSGLSKQLFIYVNDKSCILFSKSQKRTLEKIALCLEARREKLTKKESHKNACVDLNNLKLLEKTLENLLSAGCDETKECEFPVQFSSTATDIPSQFQTQTEVYDSEKWNAELPIASGKCQLLPKPFPISGKSFLTVSIDQIGVKDGGQYIDPYISLSLRDHDGNRLDPVQDTTTASAKLDKAIVFQCDIHIQQPVENLPPGFAIFLEFKHFKPKKDSFSTKCWAFVEQDEIKDGPITLEL